MANNVLSNMPLLKMAGKLKECYLSCFFGRPYKANKLLYLLWGEYWGST